MIVADLQFFLVNSLDRPLARRANVPLIGVLQRPIEQTLPCGLHIPANIWDMPHFIHRCVSGKLFRFDIASGRNMQALLLLQLHEFELRKK